MISPTVVLALTLVGFDGPVSKAPPPQEPAFAKPPEEIGHDQLRYPPTERIGGFDADLSAFIGLSAEDVREGRAWLAEFARQIESRPRTRKVYALTGLRKTLFQDRVPSGPVCGETVAVAPQAVPLVVLPTLDVEYGYSQAMLNFSTGHALHFEPGPASRPLGVEGPSVLGKYTMRETYLGKYDLLHVGRVPFYEARHLWPLSDIYENLAVGRPGGARVTGTVAAYRFDVRNPRGMLVIFQTPDQEPLTTPCFALLDASGMMQDDASVRERGGIFARKVIAEFDGPKFGGETVARLTFPLMEEEAGYLTDVAYLPAGAAAQSVAWAVRLTPGSEPFKEGYVVCPLDKHPELPLEMLIVFAGGDVGQAAKRFNDADGWAK